MGQSPQNDPKEIGGVLHRVGQLGAATERLFSRLYQGLSLRSRREHERAALHQYRTELEARIERAQQIVQQNEQLRQTLHKRTVELDRLHGMLAKLDDGVIMQDLEGRIVFMNDLALDHYGDRGGEALIDTSLDDCHNPASQDKIRQMYTRYRAGDLTPTRYHEEKGDGLAESIVLIPLIVVGQFRGVAELMWTERPELVFEF